MPPPIEIAEGTPELPPLSPEQTQLEINTLLGLTNNLDAYSADQIRARLIDLRARYSGRGRDELQEHLIQTALAAVHTRLIREFESRHSIRYLPWNHPRGGIESEKHWSIELPPDGKLEKTANLHTLWLSDKPLRAQVLVTDDQLELEASNQYRRGYTGFVVRTFPYATTQVIGIERTFDREQLLPSQNVFLLEAEPSQEVRIRVRDKKRDFILGLGIARKDDPNKCGEPSFLHASVYQPVRPDEEMWPKLS